MRERLKEAKGIGTPATRAEIIKGLKRQNLLAADGKRVVPTSAGLQLFELLARRRACARRSRDNSEWEMRLDEVVVGRADFRAVIDEIAGEADRVIGILRRHTGQTVDLNQPPPSSARKGRRSKADASGGGEAKSSAAACRNKVRSTGRAAPAER